jgi:hypothetical protein
MADKILQRKNLMRGGETWCLNQKYGNAAAAVLKVQWCHNQSLAKSLIAQLTSWTGWE